ncbi:hypothetical protein EYF80_039145 [Liparis tanakae]|uniref:Uncharacterized protein n=1 Tax=Liparis tanakae TaxID=230148 RepID=A0A4Z2GD93_9TELE|nr:hypothetical protein EYF80_039145 [Liparis tanakae]
MSLMREGNISSSARVESSPGLAKKHTATRRGDCQRRGCVEPLELKWSGKSSVGCQIAGVTNGFNRGSIVGRRRPISRTWKLFLPRQARVPVSRCAQRGVVHFQSHTGGNTAVENHMSRETVKHRV